MRLSDITKDHPLWGDSRWWLRPKKGRARRRQSRSFPVNDTDDFCVVSLLKTVIQYSDFNRELAHPDHKHLVFVRFATLGKPHRGFLNVDTKAITSSFDEVLADFIATNNLARFTSSLLRLTAADMAMQASQGDIKVEQRILDHVNITTTASHYDTVTQRQSREEWLARAMTHREQTIHSGGKIPIGDLSNKTASHVGATPGFLCIEPYFSPIAGQKHGRRCTAYCCCPGCPNGATDLKNVTSVARLLQVNDMIVDFH